MQASACAVAAAPCRAAAAGRPARGARRTAACLLLRLPGAHGMCQLPSVVWLQLPFMQIHPLRCSPTGLPEPCTLQAPRREGSRRDAFGWQSGAGQAGPAGAPVPGTPEGDGQAAAGQAAWTGCSAAARQTEPGDHVPEYLGRGGSVPEADAEIGGRLKGPADATRLARYNSRMSAESSSLVAKASHTAARLQCSVRYAGLNLAPGKHAEHEEGAPGQGLAPPHLPMRCRGALLAPGSRLLRCCGRRGCQGAPPVCGCPTRPFSCCNGSCPSLPPVHV